MTVKIDLSYKNLWRDVKTTSMGLFGLAIGAGIIFYATNHVENEATSVILTTTGSGILLSSLAAFGLRVSPTAQPESPTDNPHCD